MDDISPAIRRMTYAELGEARGISTASAERLARRRRWVRQVGNDGVAHVSVPIGEDRKAADIRPRRPGGSPGMTGAPDIGAVVREAIREVVTPLREQIERERARADKAEVRSESLQARIDALSARRWWRWWR